MENVARTTLYLPLLTWKREVNVSLTLFDTLHPTNDCKLSRVQQREPSIGYNSKIFIGDMNVLATSMPIGK